MSKWILFAFVLAGCAHARGPRDTVEVTSAELSTPTSAAVERRAGELQVESAKEEAAERATAEADAKDAQAARTHRERARTELELRARIGTLEERLDAIEERDGSDPQVAGLLRRRDALLALVDRVKTVPDDAWPLVLAEARAALAREANEAAAPSAD